MSQQKHLLREIAAATFQGGASDRISDWFTEDFRLHEPGKPTLPVGHEGASQMRSFLRTLSLDWQDATVQVAAQPDCRLRSLLLRLPDDRPTRGHLRRRLRRLTTMLFRSRVPPSPHRSLIVLPPRATACRLRPFGLDNDTGRTQLHAWENGNAFSRRLASCDRNLLAGNQGSWPQGGRRRSGGHHRGADDAEQ